MPSETQTAVEWAIQQEGVVFGGNIDPHALVDAVREYFNTHGISYPTFSFSDLEPYIQAYIQA